MENVKIPTPCPTPPPLGLNIDRCIIDSRFKNARKAKLISMYEIAHCLLFVIILFFFLMPLSVEMLKHKSLKMILCLAQYCAKVMRTNFALCSLRNIAELFRSIFRSVHVTIKRQFAK